MTAPVVRAEAVLSEDCVYRYALRREWDQWPGDRRMVFVMLNPSTADAEVDDPTIRRCMGFARREGLGGITVVNLFALRCTRPVHLFDGSVADDPNGRDNYGHVLGTLEAAADLGDVVVAAWGAFPKAHKSSVYRLLKSCQGIKCLGVTADGSPKHPLYLKADAPLIDWPQTTSSKTASVDEL